MELMIVVLISLKLLCKSLNMTEFNKYVKRLNGEIISLSGITMYLFVFLEKYLLFKYVDKLSVLSSVIVLFLW